MKNYCLNCMREITEGILCTDCVNRDIPETAPHQLKPGTILNGKYLVGNIIGEGGFGITYIGRDTVLDMKVAIKEFYPMGRINRNNQVSSNLTISTEEQRDFIKKGRTRFLEEARNIAQFSAEPGIVNVKDFFEENETAYIIMEYLEGKTLAAHIKECGPMDAEKVRELMIPLVTALSKIHKLGVIHRDISPDNIMYLNQGTCKLMDFGSARYFVRQDQELTSTVKRGYAPEEQYTSTGNQGPWTDVYGLCATMYKCITGVTPVDAIDRMSYDSLKWPSELGVKISPEFEQTIMRGLVLRAQGRCQNMDELLRLMKSGVPGKTGDIGGQDKDATMYADQTYYAPNQPTGYTHPTYTHTGQTTGYTHPTYTYTTQTTGYGQPGMYDPEDGGGKRTSGGGKKFLIPAIIGGIAALAVIIFVIFNMMGEDKEEVKTIGDYYVTGCKEVLKIRESEDVDSKIVAKLDNGEKVSLIERTEKDYWKVYVEAEEVTGYLDYHYLTNEREAAMEPIEKYVNVDGEEELTILSTPKANGTSVGILERGDEITVMAMPGDNYAYIYAPESKAFGYVEREKLSDEEPEEEKKEEKKDKDDEEDDTDDEKSKEKSGDILGPGNPPSNSLGTYYVHVQKGYLALRNAKAFDTSNEIGKMYNGDYVYAIRSDGEYWYVYSPSLGSYGYTNANYLTTSAGGGSSSKSSGYSTYYASVSKGYLALRNAQAYDSSNEIGKISNGEKVEVVDSSTGTYWYVYVPSLGQYGYVNSNYLRK